MKILLGLLLAIGVALGVAYWMYVLPSATSPDAAAIAPMETEAEVPVLAQNDAAPAAAAPMETETEVPVVAQNDAAPQPPVTAPAQRTDIVAGRHYRILSPTQPTSSSPDKVEVAEFFMYSCPHCMTLEPFINSYIATKPAYVSFVRTPASFNAMAQKHAKAYYMAETLGIVDNTHSNFFRAFHTEKNRLDSEEDIVDFFARHGVDRAAATSAYNSFAVDTKVRQADNLGRRYGIDSVPTLVINGKYVTSATMTGSVAKLREVVDYLAAKEAAQL